MRSLRTGRTPSWILISALLFSGSVAADDATDPPNRVARLSYREGAVSIAPAAAEEWIDAALNRPLTAGDRVWVDADSRAELQIGTATVHLDQKTRFSFVILDEDTLQMRLSDGAMAIHVRSLGAHERVTLATSNATVTLREAGEYSIAHNVSSERTLVKTRSGESEVSGDAARGYLVGAGERGVFSGRDPLLAELSRVSDRSAFEAWANAREERDLQSVAARYVAPGVIGYRDLDDYGSWFHDVEYGDVWQPKTYVISDWAPYRYGRWVWITPWGWTWIDDAPWGFAPFHYGRWAHLRQRWCWVPGPAHFRPTYAPALVAWVGDPDRGVTDVGWFPLGPREIYLPGYRTSWRHFRNINASNAGFVDNEYLSNVYYGRGAPIVYHNRRAPHALTIVPHDTFVSAQRTRGRHVDVDDTRLRRWHEQGRVPEISPIPGSVLGAAPSQHVPPPYRNRQPDSDRAPAIAAQPHGSLPSSPTAPSSNHPRQWTGTHVAGRPGQFDRPAAGQPMALPTQPDPMLSVPTVSPVETPPMQVERPRSVQQRAPREYAPIGRANNQTMAQERHRPDPAPPAETAGVLPDGGESGTRFPNEAPDAGPSNPRSPRWGADHR